MSRSHSYFIQVRSNLKFVNIIAMILLNCIACKTKGPDFAKEDLYYDQQIAQLTSSDPIQKCVDIINIYRQGMGLPALKRWYEAEKCTIADAKASYETNIPHGNFTKCGEYGQNACNNPWQGPSDMIVRCLRDMWNERENKDPSAEVTHYQNMSSTEFHFVTCGFYQSPDRRLTWSTQNFK